MEGIPVTFSLEILVGLDEAGDERPRERGEPLVPGQIGRDAAQHIAEEVLPGVHRGGAAVVAVEQLRHRSAVSELEGKRSNASGSRGGKGGERGRLRRRRRRRSTARLGGARTRASAARGPLPSSPVRPGPPRPWAAPRLPRAPPTPPAAARPPAPRSRAAACRPMPRRRATPTSSSLGQIPGRNRCGSSIALSSPRWRWPRSGRGSKAVPTLSTCRLPGRALCLLLCPRTRGVAVDEVLASDPSHGAPRYRTRNSSPLPRA
jgi:hypothetical protein